jgi:hypothetical protein
MRKSPHVAAANWVGKAKNEETAPRRHPRRLVMANFFRIEKIRERLAAGAIYRLTIPEYYGSLLDEKCDWSYQFVRIYNHRGV